MSKLAVTRSIFTWSWLYILQGFPLLFVIIFLTFSTTASHGCTKSSARSEWIRIDPNDRRFNEYAICWNTAATETPGSPLWHFWSSRQQYDPGRSFQNCLSNRKQQEYEAAWHQIRVEPYWGRWPSTNNIMYCCCTYRAAWQIYWGTEWDISMVDQDICPHSPKIWTSWFCPFWDFCGWISLWASLWVGKTAFQDLRGGHGVIYGRGNSRIAFLEAANNCL